MLALTVTLVLVRTVLLLSGSGDGSDVSNALTVCIAAFIGLVGVQTVVSGRNLE
jgi:hypothetical protein